MPIVDLQLLVTANEHHNSSMVCLCNLPAILSRSGALRKGGKAVGDSATNRP
jgi:hypothetical protein